VCSGGIFPVQNSFVLKIEFFGRSKQFSSKNLPAADFLQ
jgi:hypothetical protein